MVNSDNQDPIQDSIDVALVKMKSYISENYPQSKTRELYGEFLIDFEKYRLSVLVNDHLQLVSQYYQHITQVEPFQKPHNINLRIKARPILVFRDILLGNKPQKKYCYNRYPSFPTAYTQITDLYKKWLLSVGASSSTISTRIGRLKPFFNFLHNNDCHSLTDLTNHLLLAFIQSLQDRYTGQGSANILYTLRNFFKCPVVKMTIQFNPLIFLNDIHSKKYERLPSVYTPYEVRAVMNVVDRTTKSGKTIYLMMLFACVYGLRVSDIREMKLSSIEWKQQKISLIQKKTRKPLNLPLTEEITLAILDYMKNVRPQSNDPHLFIRIRAPHIPYASSVHFADKVAVYFDKANIDKKGRRRGLHALRHSLATELTSQEIPINEVATILGHTSIAATKEYVRSDMLNLKKAALEVLPYDSK